jgi:hypothetical protein
MDGRAPASEGVALAPAARVAAGEGVAAGVLIDASALLEELTELNWPKANPPPTMRAAAPRAAKRLANRAKREL